MQHFTNNGKEYLKKLKEIKKKKKDEPLTQEEIDILWSNMKDSEIDKKFGIVRKPLLGCLIVGVGSCLFWGFILYLILY